MYDVTMPKLSDSMEVGKIINWRVKEGDAVNEGDVLAEVESDKAIMELECFHDGVIRKIVQTDGAEVGVGDLIAVIASEEELGEAAPAEPAPAEKTEADEKAEAPTPKAEAPKAEERPAAKPSPPKVPAPPEPTAASSRPSISPYARKLAQAKGVDYSLLKGTGPGGRIVAQDIEKAAKAEVLTSARQERPADLTQPPARGQNVDGMARTLAKKHDIDASTLSGTGVGGRVTVDDVLAARPGTVPPVKPSPDEELPALEVTEDEADVEDAPFRLKTIARIVTASKHVIPHFYLTRGADVTDLLTRREEIKAGYGATVTHLVMLAALKTIQKHPGINRSYDHGRIIKWKAVNLGLAVATDEGLTVAVIRKADSLSLKEIVDSARALVGKARGGELSSEERRHPTFTITNLGMFDVEHFQPIVNPPSSITLAVATALDEPVVRDGNVVAGNVMRMTLSCDHRIVDGAAAAAFMKDLKGLLEDPEELLKDR